MREPKLTVEDADNVRRIEALAAQCRFRDCRHQAEPGCAIRAAEQAGTLDPARLGNYLKLIAERSAAAQVLASRQGRAAPATGSKPRRGRS